MLKDSGRVFLIDAKDPATALLAHIRLRVRIADNRMLNTALGAKLNKRGVLIHHDELVLNGNGGHLDPQHFCRALRVVA